MCAPRNAYTGPNDVMLCAKPKVYVTLAENQASLIPLNPEFLLSDFKKSLQQIWAIQHLAVIG